MADKLYKKNLGKTPLKLIDNGDGSYSLSAKVGNVTVDNFPTESTVTLKQSNTELAVNKTFANVKLSPGMVKPTIYEPGFAYAPQFVGKDGTVYGGRGHILWSSTDMINYTHHALFNDISPGIQGIEGVCVTRSGKVVVSTKRGTNTGGELWRADNINGPYTLVLDADGQAGYGDGLFRGTNFRYYSAPDADIILAGVYGQLSKNPNNNPTNRLYMSRDEGVTWSVIFESPTVDTTGNNGHIHACEFDPYYNWIWVAYGDGVGTNAGISYSPDFGATWVKITNLLQPTTISVLANAVVFGGDEPEWPVGVFVWERPVVGESLDFSGLDGKIKQAWHRPNSAAQEHIARRSVSIDGQTAIIPFVDAFSPIGSFLVATRDGGKSWHVIHTDLDRATWQYGLTNSNAAGEVYGYYDTNKPCKIKLPEFLDSQRYMEL